MSPGKADVNARCPLQDTFPLLLAANFNHTECVQLLLYAKAHPNPHPNPKPNPNPNPKPNPNPNPNPNQAYP